MAEKKKSTKGRKSSSPPIGRKLINQLIDVEQLLDSGNLLQALETLEDLDQRNKNRVEIIEGLADVYQRLGNWESCLMQAERLVKLAPREPLYRLGLAQIAAFAGREVHSLHAVQYFLRHWPDHPETPEAKKLLASLEKTFIPNVIKNFGLPEEQVLEIAELHEKSRSLMARGQHHQARKILVQLINLHPEFSAARNNLSLVYWELGKPGKAIHYAESVLDFEPDNLHTLSNLTRFFLLSGEEDKAKLFTEQMLASQVEAPDALLKKVEALAFLGDDEEIVTFYRQAQKESDLQSHTKAKLLHLIAVSKTRLGDLKTAKVLWNKAVKLAPSLTIAQENLEDLARPIGERDDPFPFDPSYWISKRASAALQGVLSKQNEKALKRFGDQLLEQYPGSKVSLRRLLERGGPAGRQVAIGIVLATSVPELFDIYRQFALGQDGPDALRIDAINYLKGQGWIKDDLARLWIKGKWLEIQLLGFEITYQPEETLTGKPLTLLEKAYALLREEKGEAAEKILKQALELEPGNPHILNNLAVAYQMQDRIEEAIETTRSIFERNPEYTFARLTMARLALDDEDFDRARELINPVLSRGKLHISEFIFLAKTEIEYALAKGEKEAVGYWLQMWETVEPEDEQLKYYKSRVGGNEILKAIDKMIVDDE